MERLAVDPDGTVREAVLREGEIPFCTGEYAGPSWRIAYGGEVHRACGAPDGVGWYVQCFLAVELAHRVFLRDSQLVIQARMHNHGSQCFRPDSAGLVLGVDSWMDRWPDWDGKLFPTLLRCEPTHFWGYLASPGGKIVGIASPDPVASWALEYNRFFGGGGHRIHTLRLELLCAPPLPERHPVQDRLVPGEVREWEIVLFPAASPGEVLRRAARLTKAPVAEAKRWTVEPGQAAELCIHAPERPAVELLPAPPGGAPNVVPSSPGEWRVRFSMPAPGETLLRIRADAKMAEARVFCRPPWSWYLRHAAREALRKPPKTGTHTESWYGLFSGYLAVKHGLWDDPELDARFRELLPLAFDTERAVPTILPRRIQNTACMVGLLADRYAARREIGDLRLAAGLADYLATDCQSADGAFRSGSAHYTSVIYIAKSILELYLEERLLEGDDWRERARRHFAAARRAVDDLVLHLDNIGTEGEHTFEDGMITCSAAQIGLLALLLPPAERQPYRAAAEELLRKHRCLERRGAPDCRCTGTTLRFWEAQYDVLMPDSMTTSPHGWSAWKCYAVWYCYLLTGKADYLRDAMDALASCAQLLVWPAGDLRWAFVVDPQVTTCRFREDPAHPGTGLPARDVVSEQYVEMISGWYRAPRDTPVFGYTGYGIEGVSTDQGGCCDNDVHECFKAVEEIALTACYLLEEEGEPPAVYNGVLGEDGSVTPAEEAVSAVHVNLRKARAVTVRFAWETVTRTLRFGWICRSGFRPEPDLFSEPII